MKRRDFMKLIGGAAVAWPLAARAQQKERVRRIGILMPFPNSDIAFQARVRVFRQELARLGWSEGANVQFDERWSTDNMDVVPVDATSLVNLNPDVIVIVGDRVIPVFMALTRSIPIVVAITSDPIAAGAAESLARPGRNVTGFSLMEFSVFGKMLEILKRMAPGISRVGMIYNPDNPVGATY
jgi:putative tryptophan/tyrosine transport system substrate-binding protein